METKQLRVGNYIERHNKVTGVKDIIQVDGGTPLLSFEGMTTLQFNPIPLTEKWLLKFGFETDYEQIYFEKDECYIKNNNGCLKWVSADTCITISDNPVKSVHQLQNLYFCITGEELMIKTILKENI